MTLVEKINKYLKDSYLEMKHVSWPSKKEIQQHTILVIAISLAVAAFLGLCDYLLNLSFEQLLRILNK